VHGANRLASNSLLEGLVFGRRAAANIANMVTPSCAGTRITDPVVSSPEELSAASDPTMYRSRVQRVMSRHVAVVRDADGLVSAAADIDDVIGYLATSRLENRSGWETANLALAARAIISAAALREESRGAHFRSDFPATDRRLDGCHLAYGGRAGNVWRVTTLDEARFREPAADVFQAIPTR
jgi:L-aspartate oxidase